RNISYNECFKLVHYMFVSALMSAYDMRAHQICDFSEIISDIIVYEEVVPCCIAATVRIVPYIAVVIAVIEICLGALIDHPAVRTDHIVLEDRKSTRLNSSHVSISYAVFCLKKKKIQDDIHSSDHDESRVR